MPDSLELRIGSRDALVRYVSNQLQFFGGLDDEDELLLQAIDAALERFAKIIPRIRAFRDNHFDHLHSLQSATFLYLTGHFAWRLDPSAPLVDRLFCLNKMLSGIELYPAVDLPGAFLLSHATGTVLGAASYGAGLVVFQNVTVGRVGENRPRIGRNVVLFPGASVTGRSVLGDGVVVSAGTRVHNLIVPPCMLVRHLNDTVVFEALKRDYHSLYLTADE